jgi:hypothetical protein
VTTTILIKNDVLKPNDFATCVTAAGIELEKWKSHWGIDAVLTTDVTVKADMVANITNTKTKAGALGWHDVEGRITATMTGAGVNGENIKAGTPTAYITPSVIHNGTFGYYAPEVYSKPITALGKVIRPAKLRTAARFSEGVVTVLIHELFEMLADANIDKVSMPDALGEQWLVEVCDHTSGELNVIQIGGTYCVVPNATFPSYYDLHGVYPYDLFGIALTPFDTNAKSFYGYSVSPKTKALSKIAKGSVRHI